MIHPSQCTPQPADRLGRHKFRLQTCTSHIQPRVAQRGIWEGDGELWMCSVICMPMSEHLQTKQMENESVNQQQSNMSGWTRGLDCRLKIKHCFLVCPRSPHQHTSHHSVHESSPHLSCIIKFKKKKQGSSGISSNPCTHLQHVLCVLSVNEWVCL